MRRSTLAGMLGALLLLAVFTVSEAQATPTTGRGFEMDVSNSGDWHAGEPEIAVNPANPADVVMDWPEEEATGIYRNPVTGTYDTATGTVGYAADGAASRCGLAVSDDAGLTWRRTVLPAQTAQSPLCSDATVAAGPDGTFYAAVITFYPPAPPSPAVLYPGRQGEADAVITSTDGGRTWTYPPVDAIGNRGSDVSRYAPGSHPETGGEGTGDRPWLTVDQSTGTVYVAGTADLIQFNGTTRIETWVTASHDHARSFGTIYPVDDASYPQTGAASEAASGGTLAVAYIGTPPHSSADVIVFETSRDGGRSFTRHVLSAPVQGEPLSPFGLNVAADPSHPGRYLVMVPASPTAATGVLVYRSQDYGASWSAPLSVAVGANKPWLAVSPGGVVGVMGRELHDDHSLGLLASAQDVLAAFSFDGGAHFTDPVKVNGTRSPAPPPGTITLYDDASWITLTNHYAYLAWGDWRRTKGDPNGETNAWMARLPLSG